MVCEYILALQVSSIHPPILPSVCCCLLWEAVRLVLHEVELNGSNLTHTELLGT